ncbi:type VI secretion system-associated protein TagF [Roseibium sp. FZY0029]|uniref:type VI secretion system-associated protein TagF n=1 Tax=Roseibium sp. FZY0029 TaxID=3116647 RepID=UPI002EB648A5|nr:type VI secretion system-associated protein TagF [Roseibium sp. FZY0029]
MGAGYFGKLPARADFVTGQCPAGFLKSWEAFLMAGLAQSRQDLGAGWEEAFMTMPVWRFWLSPCTEGNDPVEPVAGAFMPNVDKVGRAFPLTLVSAVQSAQQDSRPAEDWYDRVEAILRDTLREEASLEAFQQAVARLETPLAVEVGGKKSSAAVLRAMPGSEAVMSRFWCRAGDVGFEFSCAGLPEAGAFRWLLLPEAFAGTETPQEVAGNIHGRLLPEDHRT